MSAKKKKVLAFGTFDILHPGHLSYLRQAKKYGKYLIVIIARDSTVEKIRGKPPFFSEEDRRAMIESLAIVDKALLGKQKDHFSVVRDIRPDSICLGYDQRVDVNELKAFLTDKNMNCHVVRLKKFKVNKYKSSLIKKYLAPNA